MSSTHTRHLKALIAPHTSLVRFNLYAVALPQAHVLQGELAQEKAKLAKVVWELVHAREQLNKCGNGTQLSPRVKAWTKDVAGAVRAKSNTGSWMEKVHPIAV